MRLRKIVYSLLASAFLLPILSPALAIAATTTPTEGFNLQISPLPIQLTAKPGTSVSTELRVRNAGNQDEKLQLRVLKVTEDSNGGVHLGLPTVTDTWSDWISFSRNNFDAPAGQWQSINMNVSVPKSAAFGYYFAVEYARAQDTAPQGGKSVAHGAVATFVLLNADAPGAVRSAQIVAFGADRKSYEFLPATFAVKIKSTGNLHVAPHGNIFITKGGKQIASLDINSTEGNILPGGSQVYAASWSDGFPVYTSSNVVNGKPKKSLKWDFSHANRLRFGHYTANLFMIYDNGERDIPIQASVSFWVIPWRVIGILFGLIVFVALLIVYILVLRHRLKRFSARRLGRRKSA